MKTIFWGKYFWYCIHLTALAYPDNPTEQDKIIYKQFYLSLGKVLPCQKCSRNFGRHLGSIPIDFFLQNKDMLFKWTVHIHNIVNKEIGKPQWNVEYAESYYTTFQYIKENDTNAAALNTAIIDKNCSSNNNYLLYIILINIFMILFIIVVLFILWRK